MHRLDRSIASVTFYCLQFFSSSDYGDDGKPAMDPLKEYRSGQKTAPLPTYFICGKDFGPSLDEASTYQEVF